MAKNELGPGESRIGYAWDRQVHEPYPAMLLDHGGRIELVIPFDSTDQSMRSRYVGGLDGHRRSGSEPGLPDQFWFADAHGFVCLVAALRRTVDPIAGGPTTLAECRLSVGYAIFTGSSDVNYARVNGLLSDIEGLGRWYGRRSVSEPRFGRKGKGEEELTIAVHAPSVMRLDSALNLSLVAGANWRVPGEPGLTSIDEVGQVRTVLKRHRDWEEHLELHRAIHELLEISAWQPLGFRRVRAFHQGDPQRVLSGKAVGDRWAPVQTYRLPSVTSEQRPRFFFEFEHIESAGVRRWLRIRKGFGRGINAMTISIRNRGTSLDGLLSDCGIGLEHIGHQIAAEHGRASRRAHHLHLEEIANEVAALLPFDGRAWASRSTAVYNNVKHPDRPDPTTDEMLRSLRENRLVFRVWLARRLGVKAAVVRQNLWLLQR